MDIQGLESYSYDEVVDMVSEFISERLYDNGYSDEDVIIKEVRLHGSRLRGQARDDSDLDAVVEYEGDIREDDLFSMLNDEDPLYIDDVRVDINPIQENIGDYMKRSDKYDKKMLGLEHRIRRLENLIRRTQST